MPRFSGYHITLRPVVEEILRLHVQEGYTYRQLAEKYHKPFKTIQNMIHNEYKNAGARQSPRAPQHVSKPNGGSICCPAKGKPSASDGK